MPKEASEAVRRPISFLQSLRTSEGSIEAKEQALALLTREGERLGSLARTALAQRSAADPFAKVKGLIQKLIERLLAESRAEATKKGFCDTELGKARKERDFRREETNDLSSELEGLEAKEDALTEEIKLLTSQIKTETTVLKETTKERKEEKEANMKTLSTAKDGLDAVNNALLLLRSFYKQAAKAAFVQASPVDEDTQGAGFSGSYKGNQSGSKAVLGLLETIASDFDRTIRTTEAAEKTAAEEFVEFVQASKSSIGSKTTKKELDEQDLKTTKTSLKTKMENLQTAQNLLDDALKELEELKPTCIDSGMSYADRVKKREEEMEALKKALCILDEKKVEAECK
jgi:peptidoglycan hydrolase CwlO-like protein